MDFPFYLKFWPKLTNAMLYTLCDCGMNVYCNAAYGCQITITINERNERNAIQKRRS